MLAFAVTIIIGILAILLIVSVASQIWHCVPFVPTGAVVVDAMVKLANIKPHEHVIDLGAGDGRLLRAARRVEPTITATGWETSLLVWMLAIIKNRWQKHQKITMHCRNFFGADLRNIDVIFTYLSIDTMKKLLPKLRRELRPGTRIITHAFRLPEKKEERSVPVPMSFGGETNIYLYIWNETDAKGTSAV